MKLFFIQRAKRILSYYLKGGQYDERVDDVLKEIWKHFTYYYDGFSPWRFSQRLDSLREELYGLLIKNFRDYVEEEPNDKAPKQIINEIVDEIIDEAHYLYPRAINETFSRKLDSVNNKLDQLIKAQNEAGKCWLKEPEGEPTVKFFVSSTPKSKDMVLNHLLEKLVDVKTLIICDPYLLRSDSDQIESFVELLPESLESLELYVKKEVNKKKSENFLLEKKS